MDDVNAGRRLPVQALQVGLGVREADAGAVRLRGVLRKALPLQALARKRPAVGARLYCHGFVTLGARVS